MGRARQVLCELEAACSGFSLKIKFLITKIMTNFVISEEEEWVEKYTYLGNEVRISIRETITEDASCPGSAWVGWPMLTHVFKSKFICQKKKYLVDMC